MQIYNSIYLGIVVQNNDPEHRGRIKVWVPHISTTVYNKWNELKKDQVFSFPGSPGGENLSSIIEDLKDTLPWAEYCSPIVGQSSTGYYNNRFDINTVSDAPLAYGQPGTSTTNTSSATSIESENKGGKPGALYESYPVGDAFSNTAKINSLYVNQYANNYKPATYSNAAKGIFSIPNVGAHVWVFFRDGIPQYPVYVGASFGQEDFESIFKSGDNTFPDYPDTFENKDKRAQPEINADTSTYRNKMVLNQKGAAIEIINTTDRESYKVTHYKGSYYEINNKFTALFNTGNLQLLTLRDKFETVNGHNNSFTKRDSDNIIQGNHYLKVGVFDEQAVQAWSQLMNEITTAGSQNPDAIQSMISSVAGPMADQEKLLGFGGNSFEFITKHKTVSVGLEINESAPLIADPSSPYTLVTSIDPGGIKTRTSFPTLRQLYVPDMPGGNYDIFANNRFTAKSGAAGTDIQSLGAVKISGAIADIRGRQANLGGQEVNIGGERINITGEVVYLKNKNNGQVIVDSNLGVASNVVIGGAAAINGELYVNHITAPWELQATEPTTILAESGKWGIVGGVISGMISPHDPTVTSSVIITNATLESGVLVINAPHSHSFKNVPLTLVRNTTELALAAKPATDPADKPVSVTDPNQLFALPKLSRPLLPPFPIPNGFIKLPGS
jgi:hypothetical protein